MLVYPILSVPLSQIELNYLYLNHFPSNVFVSLSRLSFSYQPHFEFIFRQ